MPTPPAGHHVGDVDACLSTINTTPGLCVGNQGAVVANGPRAGGGLRLLDGEGGDVNLDYSGPNYPAGLVPALGSLITKKRLSVAYTVTGVQAQCVHVSLHVSLPSRQAREGITHHKWDRSRAAAVLFQHICPLDTTAPANRIPTGCPAAGPQETGLEDGNGMSDTPTQPAGGSEGNDPFSLAGIFGELHMSCRRDEHPAVTSLGPRGQAELADLPPEALKTVTDLLELRDLSALGATCRGLNSFAQETIPGLSLTLFPHQRAAVRWMRTRERTPAALTHPCIQPLTTTDGHTVYACKASGSLSAQPPPEYLDFQGGLFCDEPGLGKTITALSLVLSSKGKMPQAPSGVEVSRSTNPLTGGSSLWYVIPDDGTEVEAQPSHEGDGALGVSTRRSAHSNGLKSRGPGAGGSSPGPPGPVTPGREPTSLNATPQKTQNSAAHADTVISTPVSGSCLGIAPDGMSSAQHEPAAPATPAQSTRWRRDPRPQPEQPRGPVEAPPGWLPRRREAEYAESNERHFSRLLIEHQSLVRTYDSVLWMLASKSPSGLARQLQVGLKVPQQFSHPDLADAFVDLGFIADCQEGHRGHKAGLKRSRADSGATEQPLQWMSPPGLGWPAFVFDTRALSRALRSSQVEKIHLSSATLIVIPATLFDHWIQQIHTHLAPGALRWTAINSRDAEVPPEELATQYDLVLYSMSRLSSEWESPTARRSKRRSMVTRACSLLRVHWQRVLLDEGHMLGQSLSQTSKLAMAEALRADSRWVMTGTPTPSDPSKVQISHLRPLLQFLHEEPFGTNKAMWNDAIFRRVAAREPEGRETLLGLLRRIMIRASKKELLALVPCTRQITTLRFAPEHARSYNQLVEVVMRNLLTSDWNDPDHKQSLLFSRNKEYRELLSRNVRLSCCVAGNCNLVVKEEDLQETLDLVAENLGLERPQPFSTTFELPWLPEDHPLSGVERAGREGADCQLCGAALRMPYITPCGHLLCGGCLAPHPSVCPAPGCRKPFVMQSTDDPERLENNANPKWDVPIELIEWQPSYTQHGAEGLTGGEWSANWQVTKSTKCVYMMERLKELGMVDASPSAEQQQLPPLCGSSMAVSRERTQGSGEPKKAIVYSQFWMHLQLAALHLRNGGIPFCLLKGGMTASEQAEAVNRFQKDPHVHVLLMDKTGSVGLDLSFVTYVLMLEPSKDLSLEDQVVSRAHRMGATLPIQVEIMAMSGTAEEHLLELQGRMPAEHNTDDTNRRGSGSQQQRLVERTVVLSEDGRRPKHAGRAGAAGVGMKKVDGELLRRLHAVTEAGLPALTEPTQ